MLYFSLPLSPPYHDRARSCSALRPATSLDNTMQSRYANNELLGYDKLWNGVDT